MKKLLFILFLLIPFLAQAQETQLARMNPYIAGSGAVAGGGGSCADTSCTGFLVCQNFEAGDNADCSTSDVLDNSETWTCDKATTVINTGYATTPLRGSKSLFFDNGAGSSRVYLGITSSGELYGFFRFKVVSASTTELFFLQTGSTEHFTIKYNASFNKIYYDGVDAGATTINTGTVYFVWFHWKKGAAGAGVRQAAVGTTATYPGTWNDFDGTHSKDADINYIVLKDTANSTDLFIDQVLIKTTAIGDVCN